MAKIATNLVIIFLAVSCVSMYTCSFITLFSYPLISIASSIWGGFELIAIILLLFLRVVEK